MKGKVVTISGAAGKSSAAGVRKNLSTLLGVMAMNLVSGTGTGISLNAEAFQSGVLALSEEHRTAIRDQINEFLDVIS